VKLTRPSRSSLARLVARTLIAALLLALIPPEVRASIPSPNDRRAHPDLLVSSASHAVLVVAVAKDQACAVVFAAADPHFFGIVWDFENRLTRVTKLDGTVVEHVYDADGNRVQTKTPPPGGPTAITNFLVDTSGGLSHAVAETDETGALKAYYVRGDDLLAVMRPLVPVPTTPADWQTRFVHADGLGSIRRLTDENGLITDGYSYSAFGELLAHTGTDPQPYAFAGEPLDPNVGFQYHRARWMDPSVGRFVGMDPYGGNEFDPPTLHKYLYVSNDPADRRDPTGLFEGLTVQMVTMAIRVTLVGLNILSMGRNVAEGGLSTARALDAFRRGDAEDGLGYTLHAVMRFGLAALNWVGIRSFAASPPTFMGGAMQVAYAEGGGAAFLAQIGVINPALAEWVWAEVLPAALSSIPIYYMGTPSEAKRKVHKGQGPDGVDRIDRPSPSVPGSQWHAHNGPGEGSAAVNLNGTPKHGDNSWITNAIREFLVAHGWQL